jgi:hypothetical protein
MKTKHRKAPNARGYLDGLVVLAEQYSSFLTRRNAPPHVTLERIANLAEKAIDYKHTHKTDIPSNLDNLTKNEKRKLERVAYWKEKEGIDVKESFIVRDGVKIYFDNRPSAELQQEKQREECIAKIWECYRVVQENEIMHLSESGKDESWGGAKEDPNNKGNWIPEPITYYGDALEDVLANELHGEKAQGIINTKREED